MKVGITGQNGFIGRHLYNYLFIKDEIEIIEFEKQFFSDKTQLIKFVKKCDTIVHLAALNRHDDAQVIFNTNLQLVTDLIDACEHAKVKPNILFSSSTQENRDNLYGNSKKKGREAFKAWAQRNDGITTGMIIPNVFGPFGKPYYNSVTATFCHQVAIGESPKILKDGLLKMIYINELVEEIYTLIVNPKNGKVIIPHNHEITVSQLLDKLNLFKKQYFDSGIIPSLKSSFDLALFNTFRCYIPKDYFPRPYVQHTDNRGSFVEIVRSNTSGQFSFSTTNPGITRGNHFHTRKAERFAVIKGRASIKLRNINSSEIIEYIIDGENPAYVDMPIWHTHNITNIGKDELITLFWINEPYNPEDSDTYFINV